ncbi:MAG: HDIG domain-containing protein [Candidatus Heimdallarchaeota archaeon]|nr:HDIG domain-containing protein [Candidatus Heimdallarchaeota archaeon]MCK4878141.1 HDIG domain-containing protein [Candidatus Heimdallarchaeota archaeon]
MTDTNIPSKDQCLEILKKHNTPPQVIQHCLCVTKIAEEFCQRISDIDIQLVIAGSMLHDIGRSVSHSIFHAVKGAAILEDERINPRILSIVLKHIGTGITEEEASEFGLPSHDYLPQTAEELIVSYSDNLACGIRKCTFEETLENFIEKFGSESHVVKGFYKQRELIEKMISRGKKI